MLFHEIVGLWILFFTVVLAAFWLGLVLGWFFAAVPVPPGKVRKKFFDWFLEGLGLQRIKNKPLSGKVLIDSDLVVPKPPAQVQELGKNVILSADYETGEVLQAVKKKPVVTKFEED